MATGRSWVGITAGRTLAGMPEIVSVREASVQTATRGAPGVITAGFFTEAVTSDICTLLYGFFEQDGQNLAAAGTDLNKARILKADSNRRFVGSLNGTLTQAMIGSNMCLQIVSTTWILNTATSLSSVARVHVQGPAEGYAVGDVNPLVEFTVDDDAIQYTT